MNKKDVDIFNLNVKTLNLKLPKDIFFRVKSISEVDELASLLEESVINPLDGSLISFNEKLYKGISYPDYFAYIGHISISLYSGDTFQYYFENSDHEIELPQDTNSTYIWVSSDGYDTQCGLHHEIVGQIMSSLNL